MSQDPHHSNHGHDAFLMDDAPYLAAVSSYMDNVYKELQP